MDIRLVDKKSTWTELLPTFLVIVHSLLRCSFLVETFTFRTAHLDFILFTIDFYKNCFWYWLELEVRWYLFVNCVRLWPGMFVLYLGLHFDTNSVMFFLKLVNLHVKISKSILVNNIKFTLAICKYQIYSCEYQIYICK